MTACVRDILNLVNGFAPFDLAETWDNSGLQAGDPDWQVKKIMTCLDVTLEVMDAAKEEGCNLVLSHHPLVMTPGKSLDFSRMPWAAVAMAAREKIAVISAHTNLDKAENGLNDYFAERLGIDTSGPFYTEGETDGFGRMGTLGAPLTVKALAEQVKHALGIERLRVTGNLGLSVSQVAMCTGSGGSLTPQFLASPAQVYITGDLKYHEARDIEAGNKAAIDVGHFASEHMVTELILKRLASGMPDLGLNIEIKAYKKEEDPFKII